MLPWARPQKYQQRPQKYQQRPWNSREKNVKNTPRWLQSCFQLRHPVQTMDDVKAMMDAGKAIREKMHMFHAQNLKIYGFNWSSFVSKFSENS